MKIFLLLFCFISAQVNAQYCDCGTRTIKSKWPKEAEEKNIYGIVEIKYRLTDSCFIVEPDIMKGLGYGCDEEAMKIFSQAARYWNECKRKCGECSCKSQELVFSVKFINPEMETFVNNIIFGFNCFLIRFKLL